MPISKIESAGLETTTVAPFATSLSTVVGSAPSYACRAWVNFNGTGTVAIRASGNVSSITDVSTGTYNVNFTTSMPDANYCAVCAGSDLSSGTVVIPKVYSTSYVNVLTLALSPTGTGDAVYTNVSIFR